MDEKRYTNREIQAWKIKERYQEKLSIKMMSALKSPKNKINKERKKESRSTEINK